MVTLKFVVLTEPLTIVPAVAVRTLNWMLIPVTVKVPRTVRVRDT